MCIGQWCRGGSHRWRQGPLKTTAERKRRTFRGYEKNKKDIEGREGIKGWEGQWEGESERMRRARGARIIGQADALAASCGGPAAVERLFPCLALAFSDWQFPRLTNPNIPLSGLLFPPLVT